VSKSRSVNRVTASGFPGKNGVDLQIGGRSCHLYKS